MQSAAVQASQGRLRRPLIAAVVVVGLFAAGCFSPSPRDDDSDGSDEVMEATYDDAGRLVSMTSRPRDDHLSVDRSIVPRVAALAGTAAADGPTRVVARVVDRAGVPSDFVASELLLFGDDAELQRFMGAYGAELVYSSAARASAPTSQLPSTSGSTSAPTSSSVAAGTPYHLVRFPDLHAETANRARDTPWQVGTPAQDLLMSQLKRLNGAGASAEHKDWIIIDSATVGDEIMILLRPAPGALPEPDDEVMVLLRPAAGQSDLEFILERARTEAIEIVPMAAVGDEIMVILRPAPGAASTATPGYELTILLRPGHERPDDLVRLLSAAQAAAPNPDARPGGGEPEVHLRFSSEDGLALMALYADAAVGGFSVSPNWVGEPALNHLQAPQQTFLDGRSLEFPNGSGQGYDQDASNWYYMRDGSTADIGVFPAWQALERTDRLENKVPVALVDKDFFPDDDYPLHLGWPLVNDVNPLNGGDPGDGRHGDLVAKVGFGVADNGFGVAGPGGPVSELLLVHMDYSLDQTLQALDAAVQHGIKIASMSYGWYVTGVLSDNSAWHQEVKGVGGKMQEYRDAGLLIFAAAHNHNRNLDQFACGSFLSWTLCQEQLHMVPCEFEAVVCVGGLGFNSKNRYFKDSESGSNLAMPWVPAWGQALPQDALIINSLPGTVDLFAPWPLYWSTPGAASAGTGGGTSAATPFAAGVAALIWAVDPGLDPDGVEAILRQTAHSSPDAFVPRTVNAFGAIKSMLCPNEPDIFITSPTEGSLYALGQSVPFAVGGTAAEPVSVQWFGSLAGDLSTQYSFSRSNLQAGAHEVQIVAHDACGTRVEDITHFTVSSQPTVSITSPADGGTHDPSRTLTLGASEPPTGTPCSGLPSLAWVWTSSLQGELARGLSAQVTLQPGVHRITLSASSGECSASQSITVSVQATNTPPTATLTSPSAGSRVADQQDAAGPYTLVNLAGSGSDPEDGTLAGSALVWTVQTGTGAPATVGTGASVAGVRLGVADTCGASQAHTITLRVTDNEGASASKSIVVTVQRICPQ